MIKRQEKEAIKEEHLYKHTTVSSSLQPLLDNLYPSWEKEGEGKGVGEVGEVMDLLFEECPIFEEENFERVKGMLVGL